MKQTVLARVSIGWWCWSLAGLWLAVAFLAHDVAMAGDPHTGNTATAHLSRSSAHTHPHAVAPASDHVDVTEIERFRSDSCLVVPCGPPTDCGVRQPMARPAVGHGDGLDPSVPSRIAGPLPEHPPFRAIVTGGDSPTMPPAVRRALLQVFLI